LRLLALGSEDPELEEVLTGGLFRQRSLPENWREMEAEALVGFYL
jgi:hypothetical protein